MNTELAAKDLLNSRMAYVTVSRGARDAQIFTNDAASLGQDLRRDMFHARDPTGSRLKRYRAGLREAARSRT